MSSAKNFGKKNFCQKGPFFVKKGQKWPFFFQNKVDFSIFYESLGAPSEFLIFFPELGLRAGVFSRAGRARICERLARPSLSSRVFVPDPVN